MFEQIIRKRQAKTLKRLCTTPRTKRIENWSCIKTIGIIFNVGNEYDWNTLYNFVKEQERENKTVWLIGFQRNKMVINYIFTHPRITICHEKEDFDFFKMPKKEAVEGFAGHHYDLLIDATATPNFYAQYMAAITNADLKVTSQQSMDSTADGHTATLPFDLMIRTSTPMQLSCFFEELVRYLSMIRK